jgi:NADPH:quinone reductase-like Zn-dependent oxidoreductase
MTLVPGGGYAEQVVVHERELIPVPDGWTDAEAGAAAESYLTAFDALFERGHARAGERVLVHAVGSGVGLAVVELARAAGLHTVGTSRSPEKLARAVERGLHTPVLVGDGAPLPEVDIVIDLVGGRGVTASLKALAPQGRLVVVGLLAGATAELPLGLLLSRRLHIEGTVLRSRPIEEKIALSRAFTARGLGLVRPPVVDSVYPASEAAAAHRRMEDNASFGRIVLTW